VFEQNVFINCPFDPTYLPLLNSILFCVIRSGLRPRLTTERADAGENRLSKICLLMRESRFSIHDLSRCEATAAGEISRMNMPFELGIDHGYRTSGDAAYATKRFLVLDERPYRLQRAISDINGWDPMAHEGKAQTALGIVRRWLNQEAGTDLPGGQVLFGQSLIFDEWKYAQPDHARADVDAYAPFELIKAMTRWNELGCPNDPAIR
jgi:hypothetical protein